MANRNSAGFGLIPTRVLGQGPSTAGFGQYWIDAGDSTTIYNGEAVYSAVGSILGAQGSATAVTLGVLQGVFYNAATTLKPTWQNYYADVTPANSEDIQAFVYDNPFQIYRCASDDAVATTVAGAHEVIFQTFGFNTTAGSTATGKSSATLDIGSTHATNDTWKLLGLAEDPENEDLTAAYCSVNVIQNLNEIIDST
jgi:hypothetical protein